MVVRIGSKSAQIQTESPESKFAPSLLKKTSGDRKALSGKTLIWNRLLRTGKEIRFRFWLSEDKAGKEAKRRPTGW